jgi:uncharacterized protein (TIGR02145 family)
MHGQKESSMLQSLILFFIIPGMIAISSCSKKVNNYVYFYPSCETIRDADSNEYHTVFIKGQTWMMENLKTTHYHNGDTIPNVRDGKDWENLKTGAYCDYDNDPARSEMYGKLYNWYAVNQGNLCPYPFHVPYDHEWKTLTDTLGGISVAGGILKETGTAHWQINTGATDQYGFKALPGGYRESDGTFIALGLHGYWWGYTGPTGVVLSWSMNFDDMMINRSEKKKEAGLSVRCVRDY